MNKPFLLLFALLAAAPAVAEETVALTLHDAVSAALARSPGVAAAVWAREESASGARLARDAFHPQAWLSSTPGYASGLPVAVAGRVPAIAGVELRQTIFDPSVRAAALDAGAAEAERSGAAEAARMEVAQAVIALYARCRADLAAKAAAARRVAASQEIAAHAEARRGEGRETELAVERASLALARARQRSLDADSEADLDFRELRLATGLAPGRSPSLPDDPGSTLPPPTSDRGAIHASDSTLRALDRRIGLLQASERARAHPAAPVVEAEAQYWRLSRANGYDRYYRQFKADDWSVGIAVTVPLFSGGRFAEERRRAVSAVRRAQAEARQREQELDILVSRRAAAIERSVSAVTLARRALGVAAGAVSAAEALRREGRGDPDTVSERMIELAEAEEGLVRAEVDLAAARAGALAATGELLALFSPPPS